MNEKIVPFLPFIPESVLKDALDISPMEKLPKTEKRAAWSKRFLAVLWVLKTIQAGRAFSSIHEVINFVPKMYPTIQSFAVDLMKINPLITDKVLSWKLIHEKKDLEVKRAIMFMLREGHDKVADRRSIVVDRYSLRLIKAMRKLPSGETYANLKELFTAIRSHEPNIGISPQILAKRISTDYRFFNSEVLDEYLKHIKPGYIFKGYKNKKLAQVEKLCVPELEEMSHSDMKFKDLAEIYLSFSETTRAAVPFLTLYNYAEERVKLFDKISDITSAPIVFSKFRRNELIAKLSTEQTH